MADGIDPRYFDSRNGWDARRRAILDGSRNRFVDANVTKVSAVLAAGSTGARIVINIGAWALGQFLSQETYLNVYQVAQIGATAKLDKTRITVDTLLDFGPEANEYYFGAAALESAGVRFYGEYCMTLDPKLCLGVRVFDRDSYELAFMPLGEYGEGEKAALSQALRGTWDCDLDAMVALKCRELLEDPNRLITEGRIGETMLRGEEFIEVHVHRPDGLAPHDVTEVRVAPADIATEEHILSAYYRGTVPSAEELLWLQRRALAEAALTSHEIPCRVTDASSTR